MDDEARSPFSLEANLTCEILSMLPLVDAAKLHMTDRHVREIGRTALPNLLTQRGLHPSWSWQKGRMVEDAHFFENFQTLEHWLPGPNSNSGSTCNNVETGEGPWLWLTGGTDWQLFQGVYRQVLEKPARPCWISFEVRIAAPAYSGAFVALASGLKNWGLSAPALVFSYIGDERQKTQRCFVVQGNPKQYSSSRVVLPDIKPDRAYSIAVCLDWTSHVMSIWVDGEQRIEKEPFNTDADIQMVAVYNWRSSARTALANLCIGDNPPPLGPVQGTIPPPPCIQKRSRCSPCAVSLWAVGAFAVVVASVILPYAL
eukprot:gnl/MRDRNA2_/MRDRNA2_102700_c0_seq1.p1 gnl/MRDRNA2_/MRDRNA2_102700_c0~~gnl/MRDRNA2_/MRDRNA2_102700_c0_seq1.p1  ORF type:complete len:338 (+),score=56.21 gnl/MRDRNA2_/MRDRNA2_102700_c0_seq1:75-1016(+)